MDAAFRRDPVNRATFMKILQQPSGITHAMRLMNQTSVLGRYLWPFRRIVGQMQHDLFHVYTVDQHILMVLRNVRRFFMAEHAHEYRSARSWPAAGTSPGCCTWPRCSTTSARARRRPLHHRRRGGQALLPRPRHCARRRRADRIPRARAPDHEPGRTKQDLSDPEVIQAFAERVGNERNLTALYLLTVADIRGTSPKVWSAWKGKLLEDTYRLTCASGRTRARCCRRNRGPPPRGPGAAGTDSPALRIAQEAPGHAGRGLFHAPRGGRHRLAHAPPVAPRAPPAPWCARSLAARGAGAGLRA
ncbi:AP2-interacting clathrin-endocytosis protein [Manis javanica]|nr:AP2-interacting clathrin-endocytosis protein [Manis javanica]